MEPRAALSLTLALAAMLASPALVRAQAPGPAEQAARLARANQAAREAEARSKALEAQADAARDAAAKAAAAEGAVQARIQAAAAQIAAAQARIAIADRQLAEQRLRLFERQAPILRLVAALQSMARRPPALSLVQPGSTQDMVHVRAMLGTMLPVMAKRTAAVRAEVARVRALREEAQAALASLRAGQARIESERVALVKLQAENRARGAALDRSALQESDRAIALGEAAREIVGQIDVARAAADVEAGLRALPGPLPRPDSFGASPPAGAARAAPYRLPVDGRLLTGMGEVSPTGVRARGLTFAVAAGAPVAAPAGGRVLYAAPFRDYGTIVIVDHGNGWTSLIAGIDTLAVAKGAQVAQGQPLGTAAGGDDSRVTVELRRHGEPMDIASLLW